MGDSSVNESMDDSEIERDLAEVSTEEETPHPNSRLETEYSKAVGELMANAADQPEMVYFRPDS
jgi:hypothetical protein